MMTENIDSYKYKNNKNKIEGNVDKQLSHETLKNKLKKHCMRNMKLNGSHISISQLD